MSDLGRCPTPIDCREGEPCMIAKGCANDPHPKPRWDHATLNELVRRRNGFLNSWGECIEGMLAETTRNNQ